MQTVEEERWKHRVTWVGGDIRFTMLEAQLVMILFFFPFIIKEKTNQNKTKLNAYGIKLKSQFCVHYKRII